MTSVRKDKHEIEIKDKAFILNELQFEGQRQYPKMEKSETMEAWVIRSTKSGYSQAVVGHNLIFTLESKANALLQVKCRYLQLLLPFTKECHAFPILPISVRVHEYEDKDPGPITQLNTLGDLVDFYNAQTKCVCNENWPVEWEIYKEKDCVYKVTTKNFAYHADQPFSQGDWKYDAHMYKLMRLRVEAHQLLRDSSGQACTALRAEWARPLERTIL
jgi:hypothetical protein